MNRLTLVIGNKNYSSWSLRAWLALKQSGAAFDELRIPLDTAIERRDQACHLFGLPKTGEDYEPQTTEEAILQSHTVVAGLVNTYRKHKRDRRDPDRRNEGE